MLTTEEINKYKEKLEQERARLLKEVGGESKPEDFGGETADPEDEEADEAEEYDNELATAAVQKERINNIDAALQRMADGKYGICEKCGHEISKEVLDAAPESRYCDNCK